MKSVGSRWSGGDRINHTYSEYRSSFLGGYCHKETDFAEAIDVPDPPGSWTVYMKGYSVAAGIGPSTTAVSAADPASSGHHGYFTLDHWEVRET